MAGRFEATVVIDRPIEQVFSFLADGETTVRGANCAEISYPSFYDDFLARRSE